MEKIRAKLITFPTYQAFETHGIGKDPTVTNGYVGNVPYSSIVFIKSEGLIWSKGKLFGGTDYYFKSLGAGILMNTSNGGGVSAVNNATLWGQPIINSNGLIGTNGPITIIENSIGKWNPSTGAYDDMEPVLLYADIHLLTSNGTGANKNDIGWHIRGPYTNGSTNTNYDLNFGFSLSKKNGDFDITNLVSFKAGTSGPTHVYIKGYLDVGDYDTNYCSISTEGHIIAKRRIQGDSFRIKTSSSLWGIEIDNDKLKIGLISAEKVTTTGKLLAEGYSIPEGTNEYMLLADGSTKKLDEVSATLLIATSKVLGGILANSTTNKEVPTGKYYELYLTESGKAYTYVPWSNINDSYATALVVGDNSGSVDNSNKIGLTIGGVNSSFITVPYATNAGGVSWDNVSGKPGIVTTKDNGLAPANNSSNLGTTVSTSTYRFLGFDNAASLKWYTLPANAFENTTYNFASLNYKINSSSSATTFYTPGVTSSNTATNKTITAGNNISFTISNDELIIASSYTNTWDANALNVAGYVAAPTTSDANKVWKTDANGNPAWRADTNDDTTYTLYAGASTASANGTSDVSNPYINLRGSDETNSAIRFVGDGSVSIKANDRTITISGTNHTTYYAPTSKATDNNQVWISTKPLSGDCTYSWKTLSDNAFSTKTFAEAVTGNQWAVDEVRKASDLLIKNDLWVAAYTFSNKDTGTYAIQVNGPNIMASGVFSYISGKSDSLSDEIPMHNIGTGDPIFAKISDTKIYVASTVTATKSISINIKRLI